MKCESNIHVNASPFFTQENTHREVVLDGFHGLIIPAEVLDEPEGVLEALGGGQHVEGHRQSAALINVAHPQLGAGVLPLHVIVTLQHTHTTTHILQVN